MNGIMQRLWAKAKAWTTPGLAILLIAVLIAWHVPGQTANDEGRVFRVITQSRWAPNIRWAVEKWNAEHPDEQVVADQLVIGYPQLRSKLITAVGGDVVPDMALVDSVWLAEFAETGHLAALDELAPDWYEREYLGDFFPAFHGGEVFDGHLWGVRTQTDMAVLWYRRDWFEEEQIQPPETWDQLVSAGRHFLKPDVRRRFSLPGFPLAMPLGTKARETLVYELLPFFWANGGEVFDGGRIVLDSPQNVETLKFLRSLVAEHKIVSPEATDFQWNRPMELFAGGRVAMAVGGSYEKRILQEASGWDDETFRRRVGFVPIPAGPHGSPATTAGGMSYVVFDKAAHKAIAVEILKLAVSPEGMRRFCLDTNQHPPRRSLAENLDEQSHPFLAGSSRFLYDAKTRPVFPRYSEMSDVLQEMIETTIQGKVTPATAARNAAEKIAQLATE